MTRIVRGFVRILRTVRTIRVMVQRAKRAGKNVWNLDQVNLELLGVASKTIQPDKLDRNLVIK